MDMSNTTSAPNSTRTPRRVRRGVAGLIAASALAFGGTSMLAGTEAHAAALHPTVYSQTYAVTSSTADSTSPSLVRDHV